LNGIVDIGQRGANCYRIDCCLGIGQFQQRTEPRHPAVYWPGLQGLVSDPLAWRARLHSRKYMPKPFVSFFDRYLPSLAPPASNRQPPTPNSQPPSTAANIPCRHYPNLPIRPLPVSLALCSRTLFVLFFLHLCKAPTNAFIYGLQHNDDLFSHWPSSDQPNSNKRFSHYQSSSLLIDNIPRH
jgi:hypothetical protein